jgi:hypothetical protein
VLDTYALKMFLQQKEFAPMQIVSSPGAATGSGTGAALTLIIAMAKAITVLKENFILVDYCWE